MTKEQFKKIREKMGISQTAFAEMLGYSRFSAILRKEKGIVAITKQDEIILAFVLKEQKATKKVKATA